MKRNIALVLIGAVILCFAGFSNKFPLLTSDTGVYMHSGFSRVVPPDRPVLYGLFIAHSSWGKSIWLVIFSQALILSLSLFYCFRYFSRSIHSVFYFLLCLLFIAFFMSASVTASTISAAVFSNIASLCMMLLLFAKNLGKRDFAVIAIIFVLSMGMDITHLVTIFLLLLIYTLRLLWTKKELIPAPGRINQKRIIVAGALLFSTWLLVSLIHFSLGAGFGIGQSIAIKPPNAFIYALSHIKTEQYSKIAGYTVDVLGKCYDDEIREYYISRQFQGWLSLNYLNYCQVISVVLCLGIYLLLLFRKTLNRHRSLFSYTLLALILQVLSGVLIYGRSSNILGHSAWLMPIPIFIYLSEAVFINRWSIIDTKNIS